jgi:hypothetical protein
MNTTNVEKRAKIELLQKTWNYLNDNFHKFSETNKIKIALALNLRDMPTQLEGEVKGDGTKVVIIKETNGNQNTEGRLSRSLSIIKE